MGKIHFSNINSSDFYTFPTQIHLFFYTFPTRNGRILTLFQHFWRCQGGEWGGEWELKKRWGKDEKKVRKYLAVSENFRTFAYRKMKLATVES